VKQVRRQKSGAELSQVQVQVQVTDYAEVNQVKSYSKKEVQSYGVFKFRGVLGTVPTRNYSE
jgi:hypothetical protein